MSLLSFFSTEVLEHFYFQGICIQPVELFFFQNQVSTVAWPKVEEATVSLAGEDTTTAAAKTADLDNSKIQRGIVFFRAKTSSEPHLFATGIWKLQRLTTVTRG